MLNVCTRIGYIFVFHVSNAFQLLKIPSIVTYPVDNTKITVCTSTKCLDDGYFKFIYNSIRKKVLKYNIFDM